MAKQAARTGVYGRRLLKPLYYSNGREIEPLSHHTWKRSRFQADFGRRRLIEAGQ